MAAPQVSGLLLRLRDRFPLATRLEIENVVLNSGPIVLIPDDVAIPVVSVRRLSASESFKTATVPRNMTTQASSCNAITVAWNAPQVMPAIGYNYQISPTATEVGGDGIPVGNVLSSSIANLQNNGFVRVRAADNTGTGTWSNWLPYSRGSCAPAAVSAFRNGGEFDPPPPGTVGCFYGLRWDSNPLPVSEYRLEEVCAGGAPTREIVVPSSRTYQRFQTIAHNPSCPASAINQYRIRACENNVCGNWSGSLAFQPTLAKCYFEE